MLEDGGPQLPQLFCVEWPSQIDARYFRTDLWVDRLHTDAMVFGFAV